MDGDVKTISRAAAVSLMQSAEAEMETRPDGVFLVVKSYDIEADAETIKIFKVIDE